MIVFHGFLGLVAAGWCYALFKSLRAGRRKSFLLETSSNPPQLNELVSIVIPARNEQETSKKTPREFGEGRPEARNIEQEVGKK